MVILLMEEAIMEGEEAMAVMVAVMGWAVVIIADMVAVTEVMEEAAIIAATVVMEEEDMEAAMEVADMAVMVEVEGTMAAAMVETMECTMVVPATEEEDTIHTAEEVAADMEAMEAGVGVMAINSTSSLQAIAVIIGVLLLFRASSVRFLPTTTASNPKKFPVICNWQSLNLCLLNSVQILLHFMEFLHSFHILCSVK
ncbi:hypothetical protein Ocin01_03473 [Orchesella cincta]|uniref:Uncharacterized protein n=1 Tax=Orchesella cincta TaxID=48709 RepID=A0A1D2ND59_ORCCI|nr:hypothetical protein Ocin01_03473 [Orchesella cincta]